MIMVARSAGDPAALVGPLREVVRGLDVNQPIFSVRTMEKLYQMRAISIFNVLITMVGSMGLMGLVLAIVGLYGLVAYAASRRTREIGIRMAIGANRATVLQMVLRQGIVPAAIGVALGLVGERWRRRTAGRGVSQRRRPDGFRRSSPRHPSRAGGDVRRVVHSRASSLAHQPDAGAAV